MRPAAARSDQEVGSPTGVELLRRVGHRKNLSEKLLCTRDGSLWIAKRTTAAFPGGGAEPDSWQLCVKRGADGKDAK